MPRFRLVLCCGFFLSAHFAFGDASPTLSSSDSVSKTSRPSVKAMSSRIDKLVGTRLAEMKQKANPRADDETFLRRIYLDVVGRIPTLEESRSFLSSRKKNKRAELIDELLDSPGYVSHQFNYFADVLRIKDRLNGGNPGHQYVDFVKESLSSNLPYDEFVKELLTAEGAALEKGNGATGYFLRDVGMPEDNMANTVRIFLGTRIECAQCHDHPFDKWTQRDFFEMVAFTGGLQTRLKRQSKDGADIRKEVRSADAPEQVKQVANNLLRTLSYGVAGGGTGLARLPDSYQYDDGEPNEIVTAKTMFEDKSIVHPTIPVSRKKNKKRKNNNRILGAQDIDSREALADWITSPDNPRFSQVIANRLWKRSMGLALIEPLDDLTDESKASNERLMEFLSKLMVELDFDLRQFQRAIFNSKTYQSEAYADDVSDPSKFYFPGPLMRRMTAEQLWDSFVTLAIADVDTRVNPQAKIKRVMQGANLYERFAKMDRVDVDDVLKVAAEQVESRKDPKKRKEQIRSMMMESEKNNEFENEAAALRKEIARMKQLEKSARKRGNTTVARRLASKMRQMQERLNHLPTRQKGDLVRASELPSPAKAGHFLREFGQSDRDQIENANSEAAVTQILSLMNGQIQNKIIENPRTVLMRNVVMAESVNEKIEVVFLSMLGRNPTRSERETWIKLGKQNGKEAANDLIWTLANTSEFMFIR